MVMVSVCAKTFVVIAAKSIVANKKIFLIVVWFVVVNLISKAFVVLRCYKFTIFLKKNKRETRPFPSNFSDRIGKLSILEC